MLLLGSAWADTEGTYQVSAVREDGVEARPMGEPRFRIGQRVCTSYDR